MIFHPPSTFSILATAGFGSVTLTFGSLLTSSNPPFSYWRSSLAVCGMAWMPCLIEGRLEDQADDLSGRFDHADSAVADDDVGRR